MFKVCVGGVLSLYFISSKSLSLQKLLEAKFSSSSEVEGEVL